MSNVFFQVGRDANETVRMRILYLRRRLLLLTKSLDMNYSQNTQLMVY